MHFMGSTFKKLSKKAVFQVTQKMISSFSPTKAAQNPPSVMASLFPISSNSYSAQLCKSTALGQPAPLCSASVAGIYPRDKPPNRIFTDHAGSFYLVSQLTWLPLLQGLLRHKGILHRQCFLPSKEKSSSQTCSLASFKNQIPRAEHLQLRRFTKSFPRH